MLILVTAGNTVAAIDRVRCLTNIFTGRTGARLALHAFLCGHSVRLLTSHPEVLAELAGGKLPPGDRLAVQSYRSFEDLQSALAECLQTGGFDALIHCAAVSDYLSAGVYAPAPHTAFREADASWVSGDAKPPHLLDRQAGKVKSDEPELWLRLVRAPKLIDLVRGPWNFQGLVVKFKLEVGMGEEQLIEVAERSRRQSQADLMVANTLEQSEQWAFVGPLDGGYHKITRPLLAVRLIKTLEALHKERPRG